GFAEIICAADSGGGPDVKVFSGKDGSVLSELMAYDPRFTGGVRVAAGDVNGDGTPDLLTAPGPGGGPNVEAFDINSHSLLASYMAYDARFTGGVFISGADVNGDGTADVVTGAGAGGGPDVKVFQGASDTVLANFFAFDPNFTGGVRVDAADAQAD